MSRYNYNGIDVRDWDLFYDYAVNIGMIPIFLVVNGRSFGNPPSRDFSDGFKVAMGVSWIRRLKILEAYYSGDVMTRSYIRCTTLMKIYESFNHVENPDTYPIYRGLEEGEVWYPNFPIFKIYATNFNNSIKVHVNDIRKSSVLIATDVETILTQDEIEKIPNLELIEIATSRRYINIKFNIGLSSSDMTLTYWINTALRLNMPIPYIGELNLDRDGLISLISSHGKRYNIFAGELLLMPDDAMLKIAMWLLTNYTPGRLFDSIVEYLKTKDLYYII